MSDELAHMIHVMQRAQIAQREREDFMVLVASDDVLLAEVKSSREQSPWRTLFSEYQYVRGELRIANAQIALLKRQLNLQASSVDPFRRGGVAPVSDVHPGAGASGEVA